MIPLRDHNHSDTFPFITYSLITTNVLAFVYQLSLPQLQLELFINNYAAIPVQILAGQNLISLISSLFLHGGFGHIIGNMLFLNIFGDNLEDKLGHFTYLTYYLICGFAGALLQIILSPGSTIPILGASGAIAGLMGGYLFLFPTHKIDILIPVFGFLQTATLPAYTMLIYWIIFQVFGGLGSIGITGGGVAYFAHIGGFIAGLIMIILLNPNARNRLTRIN